MAIVQISKIQHRSGNLVDLPQLDEAEFGFASDAKRVFIGKTQSGLENIEVLTSYSEVSFSQIDGAVGNLNISAPVGNGQILASDGTNWVNKGGTAGGYINLGDVANLSIGGGSIGYVLETDGLGNLSWTSKGTETAFIESISQANPGLVTTSSDSSLVSGAAVTITNCPGMTEVNGGTYYANVQTSNTFTLYSDLALTATVDTSAFTAFSNTSVTATTLATNVITVGDATLFALNIPVRFVGTVTGTNLDNANTFYVKTASGTSVTVSNELLANGVAGNVFPLLTTTGLTASMYGTGGRLVSPLGGATSAAGAGASANTQVLYNDTNLIQGDADFTYDETGAGGSGLLTVTGNANVGNLNGTGSVTASRLISNVATGTTPIVVNSTTRVANLNVAYANVSDYNVVGNLTTGNYFPALVSTSATGNKALNVSGSYVFDTANAKFVTGNVQASYDVQGSTLTGSLTTAAQPNITSVGTLTGLSIAGDIIPDANVTYDLGNNTNRFNDLYLSGTTIYLGAQQITSNLTTTTFSGNVSANVISGNIQSTGAATMSAVTVTGNLAAGNISTGGVLSVTGNANVGNIGATNFVGSGASLTSLNGSNITTGTIAAARVATLNQNTTGYAATVSSAAQPNITSVGTLTSLGVTGNVSAGNVSATAGAFTSVSGNGSALTALNGSNITTGTIAAARVATLNQNTTGSAATVTTAAQPNITSVGTLTSLAISGTNTLTVRTISTGANTTAGTVTGNWTLTAGSRLQATYADLAEYYEGDQIYEAGTVLEFGGEKEVTLAKEETFKLAGVVSTNPAYVMNSECPGHAIAIALQGRCPVKVKGPVSKGDMMVSAGNGYAKATIIAPKIGTVLGKSLENFAGEEGVIEIAVGRL